MRDDMESSDNLDAYRNLWDGSEDWGLIAHHQSQTRVKVTFSDSQPSIEEIASIRKLVEAYQNTPITEIKSLLSSRKEIDLGILPGIEANRIVRRAKQLRLRIISTDASTTSYLPINRKTNMALVIEDDTIAKRVIEKMMECGIPVIDHIESD